MDNKQQDLINQLQCNKGALLQLMNSPDGQRLIQLLKAQSGGANLSRAAGAAAKGDTADITQMIQKLMSSSEGAQIVERINRTMEKK